MAYSPVPDQMTRPQWARLLLRDAVWGACLMFALLMDPPHVVLSHGPVPPRVTYAHTHVSAALTRNPSGA